ncbi:MAG: hypothetical protein V3T77_08035 [Planctomycetota bacterium]
MVVRDWVVAGLVIVALVLGYFAGRVSGGYRCEIVQDKRHGQIGIIYNTRNGDHYWVMRNTNAVKGPISLKTAEPIPTDE